MQSGFEFDYSTKIKCLLWLFSVRISNVVSLDEIDEMSYTLCMHLLCFERNAYVINTR